MKLISWNVNGIRAVIKKDTFVPFIKKYNPDVLCLQETKAEKGQAVIDLPDYEEYWNSSTRKKGYSGTAIFVKKDLTVHSVVMGLPEELCKRYKILDDYGDANAEGRVIVVELDDFYVANVYTPNSKNDLSRLKFRHQDWDPAFLEYIKQLENKKPVLFCGDLNVAHTPDDLANPQSNEGEHGFTKEEREGIDQILKAGFVDSFRHFTPTGNGYYTYWAPWRGLRERNVGWRIDYWFVPKKLAPKLTKAEIFADVMGSDHCPVSIEIK
ncbi:exodeoxyribonuclease III [Candidatus Parcubacteria bacterium]|nr:exodeoxyribonuclease III [Candidatus Parcubacteria bacterium]